MKPVARTPIVMEDRRTPQAYSTVRRGGRREKVAKIRR